MSTASVCAVILEESLRAAGPTAQDLPRRHFRQQDRFLAGVWNLSAGADFLWPATTGTRPPGSRLFQPYFELLAESIHGDPPVLRKLIPIFHLVDDPNRAVSPAVVSTVLASALRRRLRNLRAPVPAPELLPPQQADLA